MWGMTELCPIGSLGGIKARRSLTHPNALESPHAPHARTLRSLGCACQHCTRLEPRPQCARPAASRL